MASFNTNSNPSPFGTSSATPQPNIGAQFFLGCSVIDFTVNADWSSQGGNLTVNLLEDTLSTSNLDYNDAYARWTPGSTYVQKLRDPNIYDYATGTLNNGSLPVIGSPQHFRLLDTSNNIVFQYDGILSSISRNASPNAGKIYTVELTSPLKLLENCTMILRSLPGFGHAYEGLPSGLSLNGYYKSNGINAVSGYAPYYYRPSINNYINQTLDIDLDASFNAMSTLNINEVNYINTTTDLMVSGVSNEGVTFGSNNRNLIWSNVYNVQNIYGVFENENRGLQNYARFGGSRSAGEGIKEEGLRLDMIAYSLNTLINLTSSSSDARYFGGNIISGTTTYNFYDVSQRNVASNPYFFGFDVYSFTTYMINKLGADYVYQGDISSNILDFISTLCSDAGVDFIVELNRIQTSDAGAPNYWDGTDTVSNYDSPGSLYHGGTFHLEKTFPNTVPGGIISIKILDRRSLSISDPANIRTPFSKIAYQILGYEVPDYGDKGLGYINPGDPNPFNNAFEWGAFGNTYLDPLDDDYVLKGTDGSSPYGGKFPVVTKADQNVLANTAGLDINDVRANASQTTVSIVDNQDITAKFVVGGKQSRIVTVPKEYIYQYWGDVKLIAEENCVSETGLEIQNKSIPVITPFLEPDDITPFIMIDIKHIVSKVEREQGGSLTPEQQRMLSNIAHKGVYMASVAEIRAAMSSIDNWKEFLRMFRPCVLYAMRRAFGLNIENAKKLLMGEVFKVSEGANQTLSINTSSLSEKNREYVNSQIQPVSDTPKVPSSWLAKKDIQNGGLSNSITYDYATFVDLFYSAIKSIGDAHYGKSWAAWTPHVTSKLTEEHKNIGEYEFSWKPSDNAYLDPQFFNAFSAPQHTCFFDGGRISGWANYLGTISSGDVLIDRARNLQGDPSAPHPYDAPDEIFDIAISGEYKFDFSSGGDCCIVDSNYCGTAKTSIKIESQNNYTFVPYDYFHWYDRSVFPLLSTDNEGLYTADYWGYYQVSYPAMVGDESYSIYNGTTKASQDVDIATMATYTRLPSSIDYIMTPITGNDVHDWYNLILCGGNIDSTNRTNRNQFIEDFMNLKVPDNGVNCLTFTRFNTDFVGLPTVSNQKYVELAKGLLMHTVDVAGGGSGNASIQEQAANLGGSTFKNLKYAPACVGPLEVGLAQQSTRHHYGPWFTNHNFIYAGKVEYIEDESLVPENFMFPVYSDQLSSSDINSPSGLNLNQLSGFAGLNFAGQAIANSIDGYGQFAAEDGSLTIPGPPQIKRIGDALFGGPYITSISVSVGVQGINTQYNFNSVTPRAGKTNQDIVEKLKRVSTNITKNRGNYYFGGRR